MINYNKGCGDGVLLSGLADNPGIPMHFKSFGNSPGGVAVVQFIPLAALMKSTPPTSAQVSWTRKFYQTDTGEKVGIATAKNAHCTAKGQIATMMWSEKGSNAGQCSYATLDSTGAVSVAPKFRVNKNLYECTDMNVDSTGTYAYTTGHGHDPVAKIGYKPFVTKIKIADGAEVWTKSYEGGGGNPKLIFNECFGIATMADGLVMSCGTGIEDCQKAMGDDGKATKSTKSARELADCKAGKGDLRQGAVARAAAIWQLLVIKVDFDGTLKWQQVMSYKKKGAEDKPGDKGFAADSSGGEWAIATKDGGFAIVADQQNGSGVMKSKAAGQNWGANAPSVSTCKDDHAALSAEAAKLNLQVTSCLDLADFFKGNHCSDPKYGQHIKRLCPKTCACTSPTCCASTEATFAQVDTIVPDDEWHEEKLVTPMETDYSQGKF